jgi:hypothetical protein
MTDVNDQGPAQDVHVAEPPSRLDYQHHETTLFSAQLATLLLRILAIYAILIILPNLSYLIWEMLRAVTHGSAVTSLNSLLFPSIYLAIHLAAVGLLIWWAPMIGRRLVRTAPDLRGQAIDTLTAQSIAVSLLGLYLVADTLPQLIQYMIVSLQTYERSRYELIPYLAKIVLGLTLFLRARGFSVLWHKMRSSARYQDVEERQET